jgi:hypothetical protein
MERRTIYGSWLPIEEMPHDDSLVLAATADDHIMVWKASVLASAMAPGTPDHLIFPATRFILASDLLGLPIALR